MPVLEEQGSMDRRAAALSATSNNAFEPSDWRQLWRAAGALREFAPAARSYRRLAAAQRER